MNKAIEILTHRLADYKSEQARLEYEIPREIEQCNIRARERVLEKLKVWIVEIEEGIDKLTIAELR